MQTLKQLREQVQAKRAELAEVFKHKDPDTGEYDFQKADAAWLGDEVLKLEGTEKTMAVIKAMEARQPELADLQDELTKRESAEAAGKALEQDQKTAVNRPGFPGSAYEQKGEAPKSFGEQITESEIFKAWTQKSRQGESIELDLGLRDMQKALFETTAGWPPESLRSGVVTPAVTRPLQVTDIMPMGNTGFAQVVYMEETLRTHAAAETAEGGTYPESSFELTEQNSPVRKIADSVPVTDEQLEDVAMVQSYLEGRLNFGVQQRLDKQIINGDGIAPNLTGILNTVGIQTNANAGEPVPDTIFNCMTDVQVVGRAQPTHVLLHPTDWSAIRLLRTADGIYIWGSPSEAGPARIWGLPVVSNEVLTAGTGLIGSFLLPWITLIERRGIVIERGFTGADFIEGKSTIRASGRWAVVVYRPAAFCTATGL